MRIQEKPLKGSCLTQVVIEITLEPWWLLPEVENSQCKHVITPFTSDMFS